MSPTEPSAKRRILVIDDDAFHSKTVRRALESTERFEVVELNDPRHAVRAVHDHRPDLVLLDVMMPQKDGGQVAAELRADLIAQHTPIVFLTAVLDPSEVGAQGNMIGGFPFVAKPVSKADLIKVIERYLPDAPTH